jgi:hypothetical protein
MSTTPCPRGKPVNSAYGKKALASFLVVFRKKSPYIK